jgi:peptide/nickel transport system substrate-binding protein
VTGEESSLLVSLIGKEQTMFNKIKLLYLLVILALILAACSAQPATPEPIVETLVVTEVIEATPVETIQVVTPTPEPSGPRTLVICMGSEPDTLYTYGTDGLATFQILQAIAEGGWGAFDNNSFAYQAVILEKLPSLADGDAALTPVVVGEGDRVVDATGDVVNLDPAADPPILLSPAGGGEPLPYQGGEFEMDQLSATFKLLPDLLWSDGASLKASDSVYAFNLLADPDTQGIKFKIERTASYEALDDLTTVWTGLPGFLDSEYYINFFGPAPEHTWGNYSAADLLTAEESHLKPVGWGPYMIDEWVHGENITLRKNPNYFRSAEGLPKFDTLIFRFVSSSTNALIASLLAGECDIVERASLIADQSQLLLELQDSDQLNSTFTTGTRWEHLDFGVQPRAYDDGYQIGVDRPDFFSDVRTRRAFAMCMDRQALVDKITFGQSTVIDTYLPPQHPLYNREVRHYDFDVAAGSALLEEVGWLDEDNDPNTPRIAQGVANVPDGTPLALIYETNTFRTQIADILQESLAQCGIKANIQINPELFADGPDGTIFGRQFDLGQFLWLTGVKPPCDLYLSNLTPGPAGETWISIQDGLERDFEFSGWGGQNHQGFVNEEYDRACNTALGSLPGQPEYEAAHLEAQRIFAEQLPVVPLYLQIQLAATRPDLCGFIMDPTNPSEFWNIEEFDYGEGCEE